MELHKLDSKMSGFISVKIFYFSKNLTSLNQSLALRCRELKSTSMIHSAWISQGVIRIRITTKERALSLKNDNDLNFSYPDFALVNGKHKWIFLFCLSKLSLLVNIGEILVIVVFY